MSDTALLPATWEAIELHPGGTETVRLAGTYAECVRVAWALHASGLKYDTRPVPHTAPAVAVSPAKPFRSPPSPPPHPVRSARRRRMVSAAEPVSGRLYHARWRQFYRRFAEPSVFDRNVFAVVCDGRDVATLFEGHKYDWFGPPQYTGEADGVKSLGEGYGPPGYCFGPLPTLAAALEAAVRAVEHVLAVERGRLVAGRPPGQLRPACRALLGLPAVGPRSRKAGAA